MRPSSRISHSANRLVSIELNTIAFAFQIEGFTITGGQLQSTMDNELSNMFENICQILARWQQNCHMVETITRFWPLPNDWFQSSELAACFQHPNNQLRCGLRQDFKSYNLCIKGCLTPSPSHWVPSPWGKSYYCGRMSYDFLLCCNSYELHYNFYIVTSIITTWIKRKTENFRFLSLKSIKIKLQLLSSWPCASFKIPAKVFFRVSIAVWTSSRALIQKSHGYYVLLDTLIRIVMKTKEFATWCYPLPKRRTKRTYTRCA